MTIRDLLNRLLGFSVTRICLPIIALFLALIVRDIVLILVQYAVNFREGVPTIYLGRKGPVADNFNSTTYSVFACVLLITLGYLAYTTSVKSLEKRKIDELEVSGAAKEFGLGTIVGIGIISNIAAVIWMCGAIHIESRAMMHAFVASAAAALSAAFIEELAIRGVVFRVLESRLGTWVTLGLTSLLFGAMHLGNENASVFAALSIALTAGLVLGLAFVVTRRLWFAIGIHFAANLTQGAILGMPVSGNVTPGLFVSEFSGPSWLTGGDFGIEASFVTVVLATGVAIVFGIIAIRTNQIKPPYWKNPTDSTERID